VNAGGTSPSFNATGAGVEQAVSASRATEVEGSNTFMESLSSPVAGIVYISFLHLNTKP